MRVERYTFGINVVLTLGEPLSFRVKDWVMRSFRPNCIVANAPCPGFVVLYDAIVDATSVLGSPESQPPPQVDAFHLFNDGHGQEIEETPCEHGAAMMGAYTGFVPEGFTRGQMFTFILTFSGPAQIQKEKA